MILHARAPEITKRRTVCGIPIERGVHRVGIAYFERRVEQRVDNGIDACPACRAAIRSGACS